MWRKPASHGRAAVACGERSFRARRLSRWNPRVAISKRCRIALTQSGKEPDLTIWGKVVEGCAHASACCEDALRMSADPTGLSWLLAMGSILIAGALYGTHRCFYGPANCRAVVGERHPCGRATKDASRRRRNALKQPTVQVVAKGQFRMFIDVEHKCLSSRGLKSAMRRPPISVATTRFLTPISLRKRPSCLKSEARFSVRAIWHPRLRR